MSSMPDHEFEIHIAEGSAFTLNPLWFTDATRVTDLRTGKVVKNRSPDGPTCKVVLTLGPARDEFFIVRDPTMIGPMKFNYGPMNATLKRFLRNDRSPATLAPDGQALAMAEKLADKAKGLAALVEGKQVRVVRAVVYEGEGSAVMEILSKSLPVGTTQITNRGGQGKYKITVSQGEIELAQPDPERIEVCRLDPDTLVGIALCEDGSEGWVVMRWIEQIDGGFSEAVGDEHGAIVYVDILDAAEVLRTGIVWKHDMGEDPDADEP